MAPPRQSLDDEALLTLYARGRAAGALARARLLAEISGEEADPALGDLDRRVWALRLAVVGPGGEAVCLCPDCRAWMEFELPPDFAPPPAVQNPAVVLWRRRRFALRPPRLSDMGPQGFDPCVLAPEAPWEEPEFVRRAAEALEAADPALRMRILAVCPDCAAENALVFDPVGFFWSEIERLARALARDVARLARHYGWSEGEILAMGAARRALYLEEAEA